MLLLSVQRMASTRNQPTRSPAILFALAALAAFCSGCRQETPQTRTAAVQQAPVEVRVAPVMRRAVQRGIDVTGTLYGDDEAQIAAKTSGRVAAVPKDVGDHVAAGELLAQIDRTDYELERQQREAALREALAKLGLDQMPGADFDLATVPNVQRAGAEEHNAQAKFNRGKELHDNDPPLISDQDYADLQTALEVASRTVKTEMLVARTLLSQARSRAVDLAAAEQRLRDTEIRAPVRGDSEGYVVAQRLISTGEYVSEGKAVFALVDTDPIRFRAEVPERYAGEIHPGQAITIRVEAYAEDFVGKVARISPRVDPQSRMFLVESEIPNADGRLKPGGFARGRISTNMEEGVAFVPQSAVISFAGVKRIFSVENGKAVEHRIATGVQIDDSVEIVGGLPAGVMVVVEGVNKLAPGMAVNVAQTSPTAAARPETPAARLGL